MLQAGAIGGGFLGGTINYFKCLHDFMEKNDTTLYFDKKEAQRKLVNHATLGFCKGALKTAPYFGLFCGGYTYVSNNCLQVMKFRECYKCD